MCFYLSQNATWPTEVKQFPFFSGNKSNGHCPLLLNRSSIEANVKKENINVHFMEKYSQSDQIIQFANSIHSLQQFLVPTRFGYSGNSNFLRGQLQVAAVVAAAEAIAAANCVLEFSIEMQFLPQSTWNIIPHANLFSLPSSHVYLPFRACSKLQKARKETRSRSPQS